MKSEIRFYTRMVVLPRLPMALAIFLLFAGGGVYMALTLPAMYQASARLLVEAPQIPDNLASSTIETSASEQLQVLQQRVTTRANLIDLARKYDIYPNLAEMTPDQIVARMRNDLVIRTQTGRDLATMMSVSFEARNATAAANLVNELVTQILDENVRQRTGTAGDTLAFFQQEVQRLGSILDEQSSKIIDFQNQNLNALPSGQAYRMSQQSALQERLSQIRRELAQLDTQRQNLLAMFAATGSVPGLAQGNGLGAQLAQARAALSQAQSVYADGSPRVRMLKAQVERLEAQNSASTGEDQAAARSAAEPGAEGVAQDGIPQNRASTGNPALDVQLADIDSRRAFLREQIPQIEKQMIDLQADIDATPANTIILDGLQRDYENIQTQYNAARAGLAQAATGERIELSAKGQRITVVEQAVAPDAPTSPNRKKVAVMGAGAGLAAGAGLIALLEMLNGAVRRPADLTRKLNITPLATIPYITTVGETARSVTLRLIGITAAAVLVFGALYIVHTRYMPLDLVMDKVRTKAGL